jgi:hypothetical protein
VETQRKFLDKVAILLLIAALVLAARTGYLLFRAEEMKREIKETEAKLEKIRAAYRNASPAYNAGSEEVSLHVDIDDGEFRNLALESELLKLLSLLNKTGEVVIFPGSATEVRVKKTPSDFLISSSLAKKPRAIFIPPRQDAIGALRHAVIQEVRRLGGPSNE